MLAYIRRMEEALQDGIDDYDDEVKQMIEEETRNLTEAIDNHEARISKLEMIVRAALKVNIEVWVRLTDSTLLSLVTKV